MILFLEHKSIYYWWIWTSGTYSAESESWIWSHSGEEMRFTDWLYPQSENQPGEHAVIAFTTQSTSWTPYYYKWGKISDAEAEKLDVDVYPYRSSKKFALCKRILPNVDLIKDTTVSSRSNVDLIMDTTLNSRSTADLIKDMNVSPHIRFWVVRNLVPFDCSDRSPVAGQWIRRSEAAQVRRGKFQLFMIKPRVINETLFRRVEWTFQLG